jgi:ClpP class serine protease
MGFNLLLLLFILIVLLQPVLAKRMLENKRVNKIGEFENQRNSRVLELIHRQETMTLLGFPVSHLHEIQDPEEVLRAIKLTNPDVPLDLILHVPGGLTLSMEQLAHALRSRQGKVTVFIPHYAMSGSILLALAADEIVMDENAVLGPIDPRVGDLPAASILKVLEQKEINKIEDRMLVYADIARKLLGQVRQGVMGILPESMNENQAGNLAEKLSSGQWTNDYPINVEEAHELGLPVSTEMPEAVYEIMCLYKQARQRRPSAAHVSMPPQDSRSGLSE